jgi:hypothetical protein
LQPNNIIHPTSLNQFGFGNKCLGRVMMSVGQVTCNHQAKQHCQNPVYTDSYDDSITTRIT